MIEAGDTVRIKRHSSEHYTNEVGTVIRSNRGRILGVQFGVRLFDVRFNSIEHPALFGVQEPNLEKINPKRNEQILSHDD